MSSGYDAASGDQAINVLLVGAPNIGKSVIFNHLTGLDIQVANYSGTTVEYTEGAVQIEGKTINLIDLPGTYSLEASNEAEKVAIDMLKGNVSERDNNYSHSQREAAAASVESGKPTAVICVLDAFNFESSLHLLLQVLEYDIPVMAVINRTDLLKEEGKQIKYDFLARELGVNIIPAVAVRGRGIDEIKHSLAKILSQPQDYRLKQERHGLQSGGDTWRQAERLARESLRQIDKKKPSKRQAWGDKLVRPWPGLFFAVIILLLVFGTVVGAGMGLRQYLLLPVFNQVVLPFIITGVESIIPEGMVQRIFIGEYGFLVKGIEWPFTLVFPYVISFYAALTVLEDSGYLPRLGSLLDGLLNKIGLQGSSVIPILLGYGCGIPAIMSTRALSTYKERLIVTTLVCLAVPCVAQSGALVALLAEQSILVMVSVFLFSFIVIALASLLMDWVLKGVKPYMLMEIPELLFPPAGVILKKITLRMRMFITDGALPMIAAVGVASFLYETGLMVMVGRFLEPLIEKWLLLPEEAAVPLILGIMRRELTVLPLLEMDLTTVQLFTGAIVGLFYVPCIAIVATLAREFKLSMAIFVLLLTITIAFVFGGVIARAGQVLF